MPNKPIAGMSQDELDAELLRSANGRGGQALKAPPPSSVTDLLEAGAVPNARDSHDRTPLHRAFLHTGRGNLENTRHLLAAGSDPNAEDEDGNRPLHAAITMPDFEYAKRVEGRQQAIQALLGAGADPEALNADGKSPAYLITETASRNADMDLTNDHSEVQANYERGVAFWSGTIRALGDAGADLDKPAQVGEEVPLLLAVEEVPEVAQALLDAGADPNIRDIDGHTPLHMTGSPEQTEALLHAGADPNARNKEGSTPLHMIVMAGFPDETLAIIHAGADPNARGIDGKTPLHMADTPEQVEALLHAGADPNSLDHAGQTPLHMARTSEQARYLLEAGADPNARDNAGQTPGEATRSPAAIAEITRWQARQQAQAPDPTQHRRRGARSRGGGAEQDAPIL